VPYHCAVVHCNKWLRVWSDGGLFRRVILHGGTALASWSMSQDPLTYTRLLAESVNCSAVGSSSSVGGEVLRCLKRLPVEHVVEKARLITAPRSASSAHTQNYGWDFHRCCVLCPIHIADADAIQLSSWVASCRRCEVVTHFTISCAVERFRLVTSDDVTYTSLFTKWR